MHAFKAQVGHGLSSSIINNTRIVVGNGKIFISGPKGDSPELSAGKSRSRRFVGQHDADLQRYDQAQASAIALRCPG